MLNPMKTEYAPDELEELRQLILSVAPPKEREVRVGQGDETAQPDESLGGLIEAMCHKLQRVYKDMSFITTDELIEALKERNDAVLIVTDKDLDVERCDTQVDYKGSYPHAIGLAEYAKMRIAAHMHHWWYASTGGGKQ